MTSEERAAAEAAKEEARTRERETERPKKRAELLSLLDRAEKYVRELRGPVPGAKVGLEVAMVRWYLLAAIQRELDGPLAAQKIDAASQWLEAEGDVPAKSLEALVDAARLAYSVREVEIEIEADEEKTIGRAVDAGRLTVDEVLDAPDQPFIVDRLFTGQEAQVISGASGEGKTTLTLAMGLDYVTDRPILGHFAILDPGGALVIFTSEERKPQLAGTLRKLMAARGMSREEMGRALARIVIIDQTEQDTALMTADPKTHVRRASEMAARVESIILRSGAKLALIDPLGMYIGGEENSNDHVQPLMKLVRSIANRTGACVQLIHHVGKDGARDGFNDQYSARGASAIPGNTRGTANIKRAEERTVVWRRRNFALPTSIGGRQITDTDIALGKVLVWYQHKLTHGPGWAAPMAILREGFAYAAEWCTATTRSEAQSAQNLSDQIALAVEIRAATAGGAKLSKTMVVDASAIPRNRARAAYTALEAAGRIVDGGPIPGSTTSCGGVEPEALVEGAGRF